MQCGLQIRMSRPYHFSYGDCIDFAQIRMVSRRHSDQPDQEIRKNECTAYGSIGTRTLMHCHAVAMGMICSQHALRRISICKVPVIWEDDGAPIAPWSIHQRTLE